MAETLRCPSCGEANDAAATACVQCNFPLAASGTAKAVSEAPAPEPAPAAAEPKQPVQFDPGPRPARRLRPRPAAMQPVQVQIWLITGAAVVIGILYFAAQGFWKSNVPPVEGARPDQQQRAELALRMLEQDSTNVEARVELANVLYDTGNWSEAIVHYRSAERLDSKRATVIVDMGVCYYNLGHFPAAESLFQHALTLEPKQVFALFNLGIVAESREQWDVALDFFHRAMRAGPPETMKPALEQHMQAVMARTEKKAPPLP